jgi:hypothetical protein
MDFYRFGHIRYIDCLHGGGVPSQCASSAVSLAVDCIGQTKRLEQPLNSTVYHDHVLHAR